MIITEDTKLMLIVLSWIFLAAGIIVEAIVFVRKQKENARETVPIKH